MSSIGGCSGHGDEDGSGDAPAPAADAAPGPPVLLPVAGDPTVSLAVWFKVGSENDPPGKEGLAYLTGEMLAEAATEHNSYDAILKKLYPLAAGYDVDVDIEMTTLSGRVHHDMLAPYLSLFTDAYLHPAFKQDDFERLRKDAVNYLENTLRYSSDEELAKAALHQFVFGRGPYGHPPIGTVAGLENITLADVERFYREHYTRANAVPAVGGGYDQSLVASMNASVAALPDGEPPAGPETTVPSIHGRRVMLISKPGADASISFGFPIDTHRGARDFYALWIANSWLGEHRNQAAHLFQVIRERRGLNYGDYSYIEAFPNGGARSMPPANVGRRHQMFEVWIRTLPNEDAVFALRAAIRELDKLTEHGLTREQFDLRRAFLKKYVLHFAETTEMQLGYAIDDRFYGIDGEGHLARFARMMDEISLEEVNAAVRKYLQSANMKIAIVTGDAEHLAEALGSDAPSPISYAAPKPQQILDEDKEIASYPLGIERDAIAIVPVESMFAGDGDGDAAR